jgi:hypothetical protein
VPLKAELTVLTLCLKKFYCNTGNKAVKCTSAIYSSKKLSTDHKAFEYDFGILKNIQSECDIQ